MADQNRLNGTVVTTHIVVGTTATALPTENARERKQVQFTNLGSTSVFIGGSNVTGTTGITLGVGTPSPLYPLENAKMYGITAGGSGTVVVMEVS